MFCEGLIHQDEIRFNQIQATQVVRQYVAKKLDSFLFHGFFDSKTTILEFGVVVWVDRHLIKTFKIGPVSNELFLESTRPLVCQ